MHDLSLITTIAAGLTAAWAFGLLTQRLGLSPIVGYLSAGVLIGPYTPGFVGNAEIAHQLAELGVILLMFGVGLHFHLKDLLAVKNVAIPGAVGQSLVATVAAMVVFYEFGLPLNTGAVLGMAMAVASTVVLMRVLMDADALDTPPGHVAVGWLIVEDIFTVILLVLIPVLGTHEAAGATAFTTHGETPPESSFWITLAVALIKLAALVGLLLVFGTRVVPWILVRVAKLRSRELFTLTVLVSSIAVAAGSYFLFGASMALGSFLAGMVVAQSPVSHQAGAEVLPLRDAFAVLFFVSVGMLFDPSLLWREPGMLVAALGIILIAKPVAALAITALLGQPVRTSLTVALGLAQIGEFSFILSELARQHGLMPEHGTSLLVAAAIVSITINPLLFRSLPQIERWLYRHPMLWKLLNSRAERQMVDINQTVAGTIARYADAGEKLAVVIGFGPVGRSVHRLLNEAGLKTVVVDMNMDTVSGLKAEGLAAVFGDASHEAILTHAGVDRASHVVVTLPGAADRAAVLTAVRVLNSKARLWVRARYLRERTDLEQSGVTAAVFEEAEAAVALARLVLADAGVYREAAEQKLRDLRMQLLMENIANFRSQRVGSVMIPWARVRRLHSTAKREDVLQEIAGERFSRWPVTEGRSNKVLGYLLTKDLITQTATDDWASLVRPLQSVRADDEVEPTLAHMQRDGATICLVEGSGGPVGLITLEDILEQVVGRIEDEYPHEPAYTLTDAVGAGGMILELQSTERDDVIRELAAVIADQRELPEHECREIAERALTREAEMSTDLGCGAAVPHARCLNLRKPLLVVGRSSAGVRFSNESAVPVRLVFLLVTPVDRPESQLSLLARLGEIIADEAKRRRLLEADSESDVLDVLGAA